MSHYVMNPQINTSRDATAMREQNAPQPGHLINQARALVDFAERQDGVRSETMRAGWAAIQAKPREPGDAGAMAPRG